MRQDVRRTLVAYDVVDDRRRTRLAKALEAYGDRVQYSVFVIDAEPVRIGRMRRRIGELIDPAVDSVLVCDLGLMSTLDHVRFSYLGQCRHITSLPDFIV